MTPFESAGCAAGDVGVNQCWLVMSEATGSIGAVRRVTGRQRQREDDVSAEKTGGCDDGDSGGRLIQMDEVSLKLPTVRRGPHTTQPSVAAKVAATGAGTLLH